MHIKRRELDEWIRKLEDMGINEFEFRDLPEELKHVRGLQKAKGLGLLKSVKIINGRHTWKIISGNMPKNTDKTQNTNDLNK